MERVAVVCDDEPFFCALVGSLVESLGYTVHTCNGAAEAIELAEEHDPDLIVIDLDLGPGPTGIDVLHHVREESPWTTAVILTGHRSPRLVRNDLPLEIKGTVYLVKSELRSTAELNEAIQAAVDGSEVRPKKPSDLPRLTTSQADLLHMITDGLSNEQIAKERDCTVRSVERMIVRLYRVLGIEDNPEINPRVVAAGMYRDGNVTTR